MRAFRYAFWEAAASLWRGRRSGLLSIATISLAFFVLGGFLVVTVNLERLVVLPFDLEFSLQFLDEQLKVGNLRAQTNQFGVAKRGPRRCLRLL